MRILQLLFFVLEFGISISWSFSSPLSSSSSRTDRACSQQLNATRRQILEKVFSVTTAFALLTSVVPAPADANTVPTEKELEKLQLGHARIRYMLDHWDEVTRVCGTSVMSDTERRQVIRTEGGGGTDSCNKNPLRVQEFMGYKSINDPLYKADKLMVRAGSLVNVDLFEEYLDVVEQYREKADSTALLAYTSSWGEANPNGSKEVIDEYLEQTKAQAMESERLLLSVLGYLNLKPLPPIQEKL